MKFLRFTIRFTAIIVLAMVGNIYAAACSYSTYPPSEYMMLRVDDPERSKKDTRTANCKLWREQTEGSLSLEDIEQVVYKYPIATMKDIRSGQYAGGNRFARWLMKNDPEAVDYLILAKEYELLSQLKISPWYYPASKNDPLADSIAQRGMAYKGERLRERYALQAVRGLMAGKRYEECIAYWDSVAPKLRDCVVKEMMVGYINGAYSHINRWQDALEYFKRKGDIRSVVSIMNKHDMEVNDEISLWEEVYHCCPKGETLLGEVINKARGIDRYGTYDQEWQNRLYAFCRKVAKEEKTSDKAEWYYLAAFLADKANRTYEASRLLARAERLNKSEYMAASLRVMRIYLDAKLATYNDAYERKLFAQLQWLDKQIRDNLTETEIEHYYMRWAMNNGHSFYYWNDMLRRILLAEVCPRMLKAGRTTRALQLANIADNTLIIACSKSKLLIYKTAEESKSLRNAYAEELHCFNSHFFDMADSIPTSQLIAYVRHTNQPRNAFDLFLNERSYHDADYFNDLIGTKYLRSMQYAEAEEYLAKVSFTYTERLNVKTYFKRQPFEVYKTGERRIEDYKYQFAREMSSLEKAINRATDPNRKGMLMMRYALGLQNSFNFCWALTQYGYTKGVSTWRDEPQTLTAKQRVCSLYDEALDLMTDRETLATAHLMLHNYKTVGEEFADTETGKHIRETCDKLIDYNTNKAWHYFRY